MNSVAVVDYGLCNLDSIARALELIGGTPLVTGDPDCLSKADRLILPGVGAFPTAMANLRASGLDAAIVDFVSAGRPFLGVCLGMQLLATSSEEQRYTEGLGLIDGVVKKLEPRSPDERVPHVGWNEVRQRRDAALLGGIDFAKDCYFTHSFHLICAREEDVVATTPYCGDFCCVVGRENIWGAQFHPEKSQKVGHRLLNNFLQL